MAVSYATFIADDRYSQFATSVSQTLVETILSEAESDTPVKFWGTKQDRAIALLTAHRLTKWLQTQAGTGNTSGAAIGGITSLSSSQSSQSVSFESTSGSALEGFEGLETTFYGQEYLRLRRSLAPTGFLSIP